MLTSERVPDSGSESEDARLHLIFHQVLGRIASPSPDSRDLPTGPLKIRLSRTQAAGMLRAAWQYAMMSAPGKLDPGQIIVREGEPMKTQLETERLHLLALTSDQLALALDAPERLEQELGISFSREQFSDPVRRAIGMKLSRMPAVDEALHPWYTYWLIVIAAESYGAGMAGFKGEPDKESVVEIGYGIDEAYRCQGFMTEAVRALIAWAFADPACREVTAQGVLRSNVSSQRVLIKAGLQVCGEDAETQDWRLEKPGPSM